MLKKKNAAQIIVFVVFAIMTTAFVALSLSLSRGYGTFHYHTYNGNDSVSWSTGPISLDEETVLSVDTHLTVVESCLTSIEEQAATTPAHYVECDVPDQSIPANRGKVNLKAETLGGTASGTTKTSFVVFGFGSD